jgi:hypothetical protein
MKRNFGIAALPLLLALLVTGCDALLNETPGAEELLPLPPSASPKGTLKYTVIVPEGVIPSEESRIRLAKDGEALVSLNTGGFSGGTRAITESITEASLELDPGRYSVNISLVHKTTGKKKTLNRNVEIEDGEIEELEFRPVPEDFLSGEDQEDQDEDEEEGEDDDEEVEPPPPGMGLLKYTVTVPEDIPLAEGSRIRLEKDGEVFASLNTGGFSGGARPVTGSIAGAYLTLEPGWYVVDIVLAGKWTARSAVFRETVEVLEGGIAELKFEPPSGDFGESLGLTDPITLKLTTANSAGLVITGTGGSDASRTVSLRTPRGKALVYIRADKLPAQTLVIGGPHAARVSKASSAADGETAPTPIKDILVIDTAAEAETGGTLSFTVTVEESGKRSIDYAVTLEAAWFSALTVEFIPDPVTGRDKLSYWTGEEFNRGSVKVTALYLDGGTGEITNYEVTGFNSAAPGNITVRFSKNGKYAANAGGKTSFTLTILSRSEARLFFDYGRRISTADTVPGRYTVTRGRKLVIAPVLWRIPPGATFQWTVSGGSYTFNGEFLTFNSATPVGDYDVTVRAYSEGTEIASASTTVECVDGATSSSSTVTGMDNIVYGPGQFAPGADRSYNISLGGYGGYIIKNFSVDNSTGNDFVIKGNAFGYWVEPGIVWVMKDENRNGAADDTWYELRGNAEDLGGFNVTRRYAVTYNKDRTWKDNLGNSGTLGSGQVYPSGYPNEMTLTGTMIARSVSGEYLRGYVDVLADTFDIAYAIHADGTPAGLDHIDFVRVQTGEHVYTSSFGEISTEINEAAGGLSVMWPESRTLAGVSNGNGGYTYRFVNNSGYGITISFRDITETTLVATKSTVTIDRAEAKLYFNYTGGNVNHSVSGNTLTFIDE